MTGPAAETGPRTAAVPTGGGPDAWVGAPDDDDAPDHDVRAVLRLTTFRRLWLALGLSSLGDWLGLLATAALAGQLAQSSYAAQNFAIAGVFIVRLAPAVVLGPFAGAVADRLDRRWTLVVGDLLRFALFASIVLVDTLLWLFVATILIECVSLFWGPANDALIPNLVPRRRLEAANQLSLVATYGSAPLAALVYASLSVLADGSAALPAIPDVNAVTVALWVNALTFLVSALVLWRVDLPDDSGRAAVARAQSVLGSIIDGWRFVTVTPVVRGLVLGMLGAFAAGGFVVGLAQTYVAYLGGGQAGFGVLFGAVFVGLATGMWVGPRVLVGLSRRRLFGLSLITASVCLLMLAAIPDLVLAAVFTTALGVCGGVAWVTGYTMLGLEVDDEVRGRTFAFLHSAARVVLVLVLAAGPAIAGVVGTHTVELPWHDPLVYNGAVAVFALAGVIALVMGIIAYRQMDDRPGRRLRHDLVDAWAARRARAHDHQHPRPAVRPRTHNGWLIAFEGGDGTGKSTQARVLADWLRSEQGHDVVLTREPGATAIGVRLREVLLGEGETVGPRAEALLFAADRAHHVDSLVRPALARGAIVITDRYVDSSIAYQGIGRNLDADDIAYISRWATGGLTPDLTVLLDIPPEISRVRRANDPKRSAADRMEAQPEDFHERVRQGFLELARREPHRYLVLDGSDPREAIQEAIRRRVRDIVPISRKRRAELAARLAAEEDARRRRAAAEAEVLRLDAELRGRSRDEARARQDAARRAREEADRQLQEEVERQYAEEAARAAERAAQVQQAQQVQQVQQRQVAGGPPAADQPPDQRTGQQPDRPGRPLSRRGRPAPPEEPFAAGAALRAVHPPLQPPVLEPPGLEPPQPEPPQPEPPQPEPPQPEPPQPELQSIGQPVPPRPAAAASDPGIRLVRRPFRGSDVPEVPPAAPAEVPPAAGTDGVVEPALEPRSESSNRPVTDDAEPPADRPARQADQPQRRPRGGHVAVAPGRAWFADEGQTEPLPLLVPPRERQAPPPGSAPAERPNGATGTHPNATAQAAPDAADTARVASASPPPTVPIDLGAIAEQVREHTTAGEAHRAGEPFDRTEHADPVEDGEPGDPPDLRDELFGKWSGR